MPAQWIGRTIDGRYVIESVIGIGGMGIVLGARHAYTGVAVAVKVLDPKLQLEPEIQARFLAEAKAPNAIGHRAIVQVLDAGRTPEGVLYIAMELLAGRSLRVALQRHELSPELGKRIVLDLLEALDHAHARGFVHRDLKPDNVFLCAPADDVKLLDFGIAKVLGDARMTATGALLGTPAYMAPEQLADAARVDGRADLWAIGVIVYELMTGRLPFPGRSTDEILVALASAEPTPIRTYLPRASSEVEAFFARALARDPGRRFQTVAEMIQALAPVSFRTTPLVGANTAPAPPAIGPTMATAATAATAAPGPAQAVAMVGTAAPALLVPTMPPPAAQVPPAQRPVALWLIAGLALVAVVIGIVLATRGGGPAPIATTSDARSLVTEDIDEPTCAQRCDWLHDHCNTRMASCERDCLDRQAEFLECYDQAKVSCSAGATCAFAKVCGKVPAGRSTCAEVASCELACNGNVACVCNCSAQLYPAHTLVLAQFNACATRAVSHGCTDVFCLSELCNTVANACDRATL